MLDRSASLSLFPPHSTVTCANFKQMHLLHTHVYEGESTPPFSQIHMHVRMPASATANLARTAHACKSLPTYLAALALYIAIHKRRGLLTTLAPLH